MSMTFVQIPTEFVKDIENGDTDVYDLMEEHDLEEVDLHYETTGRMGIAVVLASPVFEGRTKDDVTTDEVAGVSGLHILYETLVGRCGYWTSDDSLSVRRYLLSICDRFAEVNSSDASLMRGFTGLLKITAPGLVVAIV